MPCILAWPVLTWMIHGAGRCNQHGRIADSCIPQCCGPRLPADAVTAGIATVARLRWAQLGQALFGGGCSRPCIISSRAHALPSGPTDGFFFVSLICGEAACMLCRWGRQCASSLSRPRDTLALVQVVERWIQAAPMHALLRQPRLPAYGTESEAPPARVDAEDDDAAVDPTTDCIVSAVLEMAFAGVALLLPEADAKGRRIFSLAYEDPPARECRRSLGAPAGACHACCACAHQT